MTGNNPEILGIFRLLKPKNQLNLLALVKLAYTAEHPNKRDIGIDELPDNVFSPEKREYSCKKNLERRKK